MRKPKVSGMIFLMYSVSHAAWWLRLSNRQKKVDDRTGFIDPLWKGVILIEHKSRGKDLVKAYQQAKDYFAGLKEKEVPRYILVSDFESFHLYDLEHSFPEGGPGGGHHASI